jgi:uncharacterized repeat protein (TIGR01451 family)
MIRRTLLACFLAACAGALHAQAPAQGTIELRNIAEIEIDSRLADGRIEKKRVKPENVVPGTVVIYTSTFRNTGAKPAGNIAIVNPVPANTTLVGGSMHGDNTDIALSADGGKTFAAPEKVSVRGDDGKERAAGVREITHVRWTYRGELAPGKQSSVGFRVLVN